MTALLLAFVVNAAPVKTDGGAVLTTKRLTADSCDSLLKHLAVLALSEQFLVSADAKTLTAEERVVAERLAREELTRDPRLAQLKRECPTRYLPGQFDCLMAAQTMAAADRCTREAR